MTAPNGETRREQMREQTRRALERRRRRRPDDGFWRGLALLGSVGWPIVVFTTCGAFLGHYLDARFATSVHFTLVLVLLGGVLGSFIAYHNLHGGEP